MESELQKMADLNQKSFEEFEKFRNRFRQIFEDSDFVHRFDKMMGNQEQFVALQKKILREVHLNLTQRHVNFLRSNLYIN